MPREQADFAAPDATYVRHRWIQKKTVEWVYTADSILKEHGAVHGVEVYPKRHVARWRAQKLIRLMVELRLHERWELREHTEQRKDGWTWTVEYLGGRESAGRKPAAHDGR